MNGYLRAKMPLVWLSASGQVMLRLDGALGRRVDADHLKTT